MKELSAEDKSRIDEMLNDLSPAEKAYASSCLGGKHEEPDGDEPAAVKTKGGDEIPLDDEKMFDDEESENEE